LLHGLAKIHATFDDPNLVSRAGLVPVMALAEQAGLGALAGECVRIARRCGVNAQVKVPCLVAGMIAGADSIDDTDVLRHGALPELFGGVRAPSTLGSRASLAAERADLAQRRPARDQACGHRRGDVLTDRLAVHPQALSDLALRAAACQWTKISVTSITSKVLLAITSRPQPRRGGRLLLPRWPGPPPTRTSSPRGIT
jgi:hypothetical protein